MKVFIASSIIVFCSVVVPLGAAVELDVVYGDGGVVRPVFASSPSPDLAGKGRCVVELPDGKLVMVGQVIADGDTEIVLVRYLSDGTTDPSFGSDGIVVVRQAGSQETPTSLTLLANGKFLIGGWSTSAGGQDMLLVRLNADGTRDGAFGTSGVALLDIAGGTDACYGVAVDAAGRILSVGTTSAGFGDLAVVRCLSNGSLDLSFGSGGWATASLGPSYEEGRSVAVQADGRIVAAGFSRLSGNDAFLLCRFLENGELDETLNGIGRLGTQLTASEDRAQSVVIQGDGKMVLGGWATHGGKDFALVRYLADGSLDATFGSNGIVTTDFGGGDDLGYTLAAGSSGGFVLGGTSFDTAGAYAVAKYTSSGSLEGSFGSSGKALVNSPGLDMEAAPLVVQADGMVVMASTVTSPGTSDIGLLRLDENGVPDSDFGVNGLVVTDLQLTTPSSFARAVHTLPDGKVLVAGSVDDGGQLKFVVTRLLASGARDPSFGTSGNAIIAIGAERNFLYSMQVADDGGILVGGSSAVGAIPQFALARLLPNGSPDPAFGTGGIVKTAVGLQDSELWAMDLLPDGSILAAGYAYPSATATNIDLAVVKFLASGQLDASFGTNGVVLIPAGTGAADDYASAVAVQPDGNIVIGGVQIPSSGFWKAFVVRLTSTGGLDSGFGSGGKFLATWPGGNAFPRSIQLQANGEILLAGSADAFGSGDFACMRLLPVGALDSDFGVGGVSLVSTGSFAEDCYSVTLDGGGRMLLSGTAEGKFAMARLDGDGSLDTAFGISGLALWDLSSGNDLAYSMNVDQDGDFILAGESNARMALIRASEMVPNQPPLATDDVWYAIPGNSVLVPVLANDADGDTDPLSISGFTQPPSGGAVVQEGDSLRFTPDGTFAGSTFTYQVSDGRGGADGATVTVSPVTLFGHWQVARFGLDAGNPAVAGELQDPDFDRIPNLLEYAFALNPLVAEINPPVSARIDSGRLVLTVRRWIGATDLQVQGMFCEDLLGWSNAGVSVSEVSSDGFVATDEHTGPLPGDLRQFGQIEVTK